MLFPDRQRPCTLSFPQSGTSLVFGVQWMWLRWCCVQAWFLIACHRCALAVIGISLSTSLATSRGWSGGRGWGVGCVAMFPGSYVPRVLCSPAPMFPGSDVPPSYVPQYLCSPALVNPCPMFPGTYVPPSYVPRYLCSPYLCSPVPMFPRTYVPPFHH